ncbi:MAG: tRNA pseudouridine(13) synthase TruD [Steroidobacteraceae bacterium]
MNNSVTPRAAHGAPVITARFKVQPEDFMVREWLGFEPDGEGDHMLLTVRKRGANTMWVARQLARFANADGRDVGFAGLKDRQAVTEQAYTVPSRNLPPEAWLGFTGEGFEVIAATRQRRKLRRGAHKGNDFQIVLSDVQGDEAALLQRLQQIKELGAPNYFGAQRFGHDGQNLRMADDWLVQGREIRDRVQRGFALSAARSLIFNAVVQARIEQGNWNQLLPGDLANLNGSNSVFAVDTVDEALRQRCLEFDVHPTGPLWGAGELRVHGVAAELETQIGAQYAALAAGLALAGLEQERRALRVWVRDFTWTLQDSRLVLCFRLNRGAFATAVLAELLGTAAETFGENEDA